MELEHDSESELDPVPVLKIIPISRCQTQISNVFPETPELLAEWRVAGLMASTVPAKFVRKDRNALPRRIHNVTVSTLRQFLDSLWAGEFS